MDATESERPRALSLLELFTGAHGAPGCEDDVRDLFARELDGVGDLAVDRLGGVTCALPAEKDSPSPTVLLASHFDEVGFMVQNITPDGFLQFLPLGGWNAQVVLAQRVRVRTRSGTEVTGVTTSLPPHFIPPDRRDVPVPIEQMYIDIGARNRREAAEQFGVQLGDTVVPDGPFTVLSPHRVMAKAFDNRVGVALAVHAAQLLSDRAQPAPNRLVVAGTVQEEVGTRGAVLLGRRVAPDIAIVLEGPPADDTPGINPAESQGTLGRGVQIRLFDPSAIMSRRLADFITGVADQQGIPYQVAVRRSGGTDAKVINIAGDGVPCVVLGVPARYIHSPHSIIDPDDYLAALALVLALSRELGADAVAKLAPTL